MRSIGLLVFFLSVTCCGPQGPVIDVTVGGTLDGVDRLDAQISLNGQQDQKGIEHVTRGLTHFQVQLPAGVQGTVAVALGGYQAQSAISGGQSGVVVSEDREYPLQVDLKTLDETGRAGPPREPESLFILRGMGRGL